MANPYSPLGQKTPGDVVNNLLDHMISLFSEASHPNKIVVPHFSFFKKNKYNAQHQLEGKAGSQLCCLFPSDTLLSASSL